MTIEEAKTEIMQIYGSLSEEKKMALDVLMAQAEVNIPQDHDGCKDCKYETYPEYYYPCCECKQNYMDEWKAIPSAEPKTGHWIFHYDVNSKVGWYECDRCHTERAFNTDFCPDCGARMVESQEGSDKE